MEEILKCKSMTTERCARLIAVATANRLVDTWISINPFLFLTYVGQYCPSLVKK